MYCFTTSISHGVEKYFPRLASLMLFALFSQTCVSRSVTFLLSVNLVLTLSFSCVYNTDLGNLVALPVDQVHLAFYVLQTFKLVVYK